jgi:hypothetical protein
MPESSLSTKPAALPSSSLTFFIRGVVLAPTSAGELLVKSLTFFIGGMVLVSASTVDGELLFSFIVQAVVVDDEKMMSFPG